MSQPYEEILEGTAMLRPAPGTQHEMICTRLHAAMTASLANMAITRLLPPRAKVHIAHSTTICPDLALVTSATPKLFLAVEIVNAAVTSTPTRSSKKRFMKKSACRDCGWLTRAMTTWRFITAWNSGWR